MCSPLLQMARSPWSLSRVAIGMTILYASYELMNRHGGPPVALTQELMKGGLVTQFESSAVDSG